MALVVRFDPNIDPWEFQGNKVELKEGLYYPYPSRSRKGRYWVYYDNEDWLFSNNQRTKKRLLKRYIRFENKKEMDRFLKEHGITVEVRAKVLGNLERYKTKNEQYDFYITLKNHKVDFDAVKRRVEYFQYNKEAIDLYNSFDMEKKYIWQWMGYEQKNKAKNCGLSLFIREYIKYKKGYQEYKEYPQIYDNITPDMTLFQYYISVRGIDSNNSFLTMFKNKQKTPGTILRIRIQPSIHNRSLISQNKNPSKVYGEFDYGYGYFIQGNAVKPREYTIQAYAVNDWGVRAPGEEFKVYAYHTCEWMRSYWDYYEDLYTWEYIPCEPPRTYNYDGTW